MTFSSSNPAVATVGSSGTVTAVADGTTTITVTTQDGSRTDTSEVTVDTLGAPLANVEVTFTIANSWEGGYSASIAIKNTGTQTIPGWTLKFALPAGQAISSLWGGTYTASGQQITVKNADYTATIAPGAAVTVGLNVTGPAGTPTGFMVYSP
ncbi:MAG: cellulose binding domain-containing protein [Opitutaceae bacterium]|nr:cellulose binding domain-containing protein [Opitutaceae bacterium]